MHPSDPQPFFPLSEPSPPRPRQFSGTAASIWAPKPLSSETAWPKALDSFSRATDTDTQQAPSADIQQKLQYPVSREDVFGPLGFVDKTSPKVIGAIGDGRKKSASDFDDTVKFDFFLRWNLAIFTSHTSISNSYFAPSILIPPLLTPNSPLSLSVSIFLLLLQISPRCPRHLLS